MEIYVKSSFISIFSLFLVFNQDLIVYIDCCRHWFYPYSSFRHSNWWCHKV